MKSSGLQSSLQNDIRNRNGVVQRGISCFFSVATAFSKDYAEDTAGNAHQGRLAAPSSSWRNALPVQLMLALVIWVAHFWHSGDFGLYEDDWYRVPGTRGITWHSLFDLVRAGSIPGPSQGRPLHPDFIYLFSFLGFKLGGLHAVYIIAFLILTSNALLFHSLLVKVFRDEQFAFLGALAFCVFPADTTQPFLTHGLGVQPALTLLLLAFHLYLSGWKKTSYLAIALVLFTYETPFLVFAAAPLLKPQGRRDWLKHFAALGAIFVCAIVFRATTAEARVAHMGVRDLLLGSLNMITGPVTCMVMYVYRPLATLAQLTTSQLLLLLFCFLGLGCAFAFLKFRQRPAGPGVAGAQAAPVPAFSVERRKQFWIGLFMLLAAYPLTLTTTGIAVAGRGTRVHTAAILGASILVAWACSSLLSRATSKFGRYAAVFGMTCFFTLLIGFGLDVQNDYVTGWREQRSFWTDLVALCPDLKDGEVIFVDPSGLRDTRQLLFLRKDLTGVPDTRQIKSLDVVYDSLPQIYDFPNDWKQPPRVFRLPPKWQPGLFAGGDQLRLKTIEAGYSYFPAGRDTVSSSQAVFLETKNGRLTRLDSLLDVADGHVLPLKEVGSPAIVPKGAIYPFVILPSGESVSSYLVK